MRRIQPAFSVLAVAAVAWSTAACLFGGTSDEDQRRLEIHLANAQSYYSRGRLPQAEQQFRKALEVDDSNEKALLGLGWSLLRQDQVRKIREGQEVLETLERRTPDDFRVELGLGNARYREALVYDRRIEELQGFEGDHEADIAQATKERDRLLEAAKTNYERVLELKPEYPHALAGLGQIAALRGDCDEAIRYLERYIVLAEQTRRYFENKKARVVEPDEMEIVDEKIAGNVDKEVTVRDLMANLYFDAGEPEKSIDQLNRILAVKPDFTDAYLHRARCWERLGNFPLAVEDLQRFLRKTERSVDDPLVLRANTMLVDFQSRS